MQSPPSSNGDNYGRETTISGGSKTTDIRKLQQQINYQNHSNQTLDNGRIARLYDLETTLGRGHFAVVKMARHVFTGEKVAVKVIDKSKLDEVSKLHVFQEVRCMKLVQHPNVVRLYEVIDTPNKLYIVLELADGGDLYDYIMRHESGLSEPLARHYFSQIVRAISYCHRLHVVHRDLKPENVVFFERAGVVKITDFGFSNKFSPGQKLETSCGSLAYSAPEILLGDSYDAPAVDIWSLGVILYMLVCGNAPFQEANDSETLTMIMDCKYSVPTHISKECKELIGKMLVREPEKRASLHEIAKHPWLEFAEIDVVDMPLVSSQNVSESDKNNIIDRMVNGNICTREQVLESLEKNEYNEISATYYLLAERILKSAQQRNTPKAGRSAPMVQVDSCIENDNKISPTKVNQNLLCMNRAGNQEIVQRFRKCSIVNEDDEEESSSSRESGSLNRRGSKSEGKLHIAVQEIKREAMQISSITEAATAPGPLHPSPSGSLASIGSLPYQTPIRNVKTLPSPISSQSNSPQIGLSSLNRYERRAKLRKASTASCSSSDASDEDSEGRNKRKGSGGSLHRRGGSGSQDPGSGGAGNGNNFGGGEGNMGSGTDGNIDEASGANVDNSSTLGGANGDAGRRTLSGNGRRRRCGVETRLRESQSLNRITEVQESETSLAASTINGYNNNNLPNGIIISKDDSHDQNQKDVKNRLNGDEKSVNNKSNLKRNSLIGRYMSLQKKICLPIFGNSGKNKTSSTTTTSSASNKVVNNNTVKNNLTVLMENGSIAPGGDNSNSCCKLHSLSQNGEKCSC